MNSFDSALAEVLRYADKKSGDAAREISSRFSSLSEIAGTDYLALSSIGGEKQAFMLKLLSAIAGRTMTDGFKLGREHTDEELVEFLKGLFFDLPNETVFLLLLDSKERISSVELVGEGTVNTYGLIPRRLLEIMISKNVDKAILAHNHPGGIAAPSIDDFETTRRIRELFLTSNKELVCHYVVAPDGVCTVD